METLAWSQEPVCGPYPEPDESILIYCIYAYVLNISTE
jgi:hypothetical protein